MPSGQGSDWRARWASTAAARASVARRNTAKKLSPSPRSFSTTPPLVSIEAASSWSCRFIARYIWDRLRSHSGVDSTTSVIRKVTIPSGRGVELSVVTDWSCGTVAVAACRVQGGLDGEVVVDGADAAEEMDVQRWLKVPAGEVVFRVAVSPHVLFGAKQSSELHAGFAIQLKVMRNRLAGHHGVDLVRPYRQLHDVHKVGYVGVGVATSVQLFQAEPDLGLAVLGGAGREGLDHLLEGVVDCVLAGHALVQVGQRGPPPVGDELLGRHLLEEPA